MDSLWGISISLLNSRATIHGEASCVMRACQGLEFAPGARIASPFFLLNLLNGPGSTSVSRGCFRLRAVLEPHRCRNWIWIDTLSGNGNLKPIKKPCDAAWSLHCGDSGSPTFAMDVKWGISISLLTSGLQFAVMHVEARSSFQEQVLRRHSSFRFCEMNLVSCQFLVLFLVLEQFLNSTPSSTELYMRLLVIKCQSKSNKKSHWTALVFSLWIFGISDIRDGCFVRIFDQPLELQGDATRWSISVLVQSPVLCNRQPWRQR